MIYLLFIFNQWMNFALRAVMAAIFLTHGWPKLKNLKATADSFTAMGFRPGKFWGTLVALMETIGGALLLFGAFTQIVAIVFAIEMIVTIIWKMRRGQKLVGGYELDLVLLAALSILATSGGGVLGLDNSFRIW